MLNFRKSNNPIVNEKKLREMSFDTTAYVPMTIQGAINKSYILMGILLVTALIGYSLPNSIFLIGGAIGGLVIVLIAVFKKEKSSVLAPLYAIVEGLFVGSISAIYAMAYNGIVLQAIMLTIAMLIIMLVVYGSGWIKVTNKFRVGVIMATGGVFVLYLLSFILGFFGINLPYIHENGTMGIILSLVIIGIASLNLLLDFDNFEKGAQYKLPQYMEWFFAMSLLITLVWIYIEFLRLLAKLNRK